MNNVRYIRAETEDMAYEICHELYLAGFCWMSGDSLATLTLWENYRENTVYCVHEDSLNKTVSIASCLEIECRGSILTITELKREINPYIANSNVLLDATFKGEAISNEKLFEYILFLEKRIETLEFELKISPSKGLSAIESVLRTQDRIKNNENTEWGKILK